MFSFVRATRKFLFQEVTVAKSTRCLNFHCTLIIESEATNIDFPKTTVCTRRQEYRVTFAIKTKVSREKRSNRKHVGLVCTKNEKKYIAKKSVIYLV